MTSRQSGRNFWKRLAYLRPFVLTLLGALALGVVWRGWFTGLVLLATSWFVYLLAGALRRAMTGLSWHYVADEHDLDYSVRGSSLFFGPAPVFGTPRAGLLADTASVIDRVVPTRPHHELSGDDASVRTEPGVTGDRILWEADAPEAIPDWLVVRPASLEASADRFLDVEDVVVGHQEFDERVVVSGPSADRVRKLFWEHDLAEALLATYEAVGPFELRDGSIRLIEGGIARRANQIAPNLEKIRRAARRLEDELDSEASDEAQRRTAERERAAHVWR